MKGHLALVGVVSAAVFAVLTLSRSFETRAAVPGAVPLDIVINEVAWGGTAANSSHEWIELYNNTGALMDLSGWTLSSDDGSPAILLAGAIPAQGYYLLERSSDCAVSDIPASQSPYSGVLGNDGERLELRDGDGILIDIADGGGGWPGGSGSPSYYSMQRMDPAAPDEPANWASNDGLWRNGFDCNGDPVNGTPGARNSATALPSADLEVDKRGPETVLPGGLITYTISLSNVGQLPAQATWLTDVLPAQVSFVDQAAPYPFDQSLPGTLVWNVEGVPASTAAAPITFTVIGRVDDGAWGELTNIAFARSATLEGYPADNEDTVITVVGSQPFTSSVLIEALYYDTYGAGETDEAVRLRNVSALAVDVGGWRISDQESAAILPPGTTLVPGQAIWCAREAVAFARQFGFHPDYEIGGTDPTVPNMSGSWPRFANDGDECLLLDDGGGYVDALVYRGGDTRVQGWRGLAVEPWTPSATFAAEGQILYRKRDQGTGLPVPDTDTAADWAQDPHDQIDGRKVQYPGWDLDAFFFTERVTETATLTVAVAPDNLFETTAGLLSGAQESIQIQSYSFRSMELAEILVDRLNHGVSVTLLLEGAPAFDGVTDQEKWIVERLDHHGAQILFMINDLTGKVYDRYQNQHAKFMIVDGNKVLVGSENLTPSSMPADDKDNGTAGRRGVYLITDATAVVARVGAIFAADADPAHHLDVVGCVGMPHLCTPPSGFEPQPTPDWVSYTVQFPIPQTWRAAMAFEVIQSPENSLRTRDGLLGLLARAGSGDTLLIQQLSERSHWGPSDGTPETDPNPRLVAYVDAARRGARVRIWLDSYLEGGENALTRTYLQAIAQAEGLDLQVRCGNATHLGVHNKMVLAHIGGRGYVQVGSINGNEASAKVNRELALHIQSDDAYAYLEQVFNHDWRSARPSIHMPLLLSGYKLPQVADHPLISEVYYSSIPEREWVELHNPTARAVDLSTYKVGDAVYADDYEGTYQFPPGTIILPDQVLVVAATARGFREDFPHHTPDFEIVDTDSTVPNLLEYAAWGEGDWGLKNEGDQVLLLDGQNQAVDVVAYGSGTYPGLVPHPGVEYGHSLERHPVWQDTDDCSVDFRDWPYPGPGSLP